VFAAMAAKGDKIPFRYLKEGCEIRSQLMVEEMAVLGIDPGRAWALAIPGKTLSVPDPLNRQQSIRWGNHTAPVVAIDPTPQGIRVIDPSLPGASGPLTVAAWAAAIRLAVYEMPGKPLSQVEMLDRFAQATIEGQDLQGFVYVLERGLSPVADLPGSGFRLAADPPEGIPAFVHKEVQRPLKEQARMGPGVRP
jgi:hypothetical protein